MTEETLGRAVIVVDGDATRRQLTVRGRIDESSRLSERVEAWAAAEVTIDTAGVVFLNSIGVREWMRLLRGLADRGATVYLDRCAEPIIEQINMILDARGSATVRSFHAPYQCTACGHDAPALLDVATHGDAMRRMEAPAMPCPECGESMVLYEVPEKYFTFLVG
ncbi:MAG: hypothetical protein H6709_24220 [Kofleriaceae bacterium]|nr:hypothetical protein [Kofleriaceae bacterium]MCB9575195.1 hypothetical protein [Kofleriaceae bacterium]